MRADLSTSGRVAVPNERGLEAASDPAGIARPEPEPAGGVPRGHADHDLAGVPADDHGCGRARSPRLASSCCWSASAHPASQPSCSPPPMTVATGCVGWGVAASGGGSSPVVPGARGDSRAGLRWLLGGGRCHGRLDGDLSPGAGADLRPARRAAGGVRLERVRFPGPAGLGSGSPWPAPPSG